MPIPRELWISNVRGVLERIANENYQRRVWFERDPNFSSPSEWRMELFGDNFFDDFIESEDVGLSDEQRTLAKSFSLLLKNYFAKFDPKYADPVAVVDDPAWHQIRNKAKILLDLLPKKSGSE